MVSPLHPLSQQRQWARWVCEELLDCWLSQALVEVVVVDVVVVREEVVVEEVGEAVAPVLHGTKRINSLAIVERVLDSTIRIIVIKYNSLCFAY